MYDIFVDKTRRLHASDLPIWLFPNELRSMKERVERRTYPESDHQAGSANSLRSPIVALSFLSNLNIVASAFATLRQRVFLRAAACQPVTTMEISVR